MRYLTLQAPLSLALLLAACGDDSKSIPVVPVDAGSDAVSTPAPIGCDPNAARAQLPLATEVQRGVIMQAFYWLTPLETPEGSWWKHLEAHACELTRLGVTAVMLPPPTKAWGGFQAFEESGDSVGYSVFDRYDLGEFMQQGRVETRYGTRAELISASQALHKAGLRVYSDIVMNQMIGGGPEDIHVPMTGKASDPFVPLVTEDGSLAPGVKLDPPAPLNSGDGGVAAGAASDAGEPLPTVNGTPIGAARDAAGQLLTCGDAQPGAPKPGTFCKWYSNFDYSARNGKYSKYAWNWTRFSGCETGPEPASWVRRTDWDFAPSIPRDDDPSLFGMYDPLLGCEIHYQDEENQAELVAWGNWLNETLSLDGYRVDATRHIYTPFLQRWLREVKGPDRFAVSEAWLSHPETLLKYAQELGQDAYQFDVPLHYEFWRMSQAAGSYDMRRLKGTDLEGRPTTYSAIDAAHSVLFVDNADTDRAPTPSPNTAPIGSRVEGPYKTLAYAYILLRDGGYPYITYKDTFLNGYGDDIRKLLELRAEHAWGPGHEYAETSEDVYAYSRAGDDKHEGLVLLLNDSNADQQGFLVTPFKDASLIDATGNVLGSVKSDANGRAELFTRAQSYSVWVPR